MQANILKGTAFAASSYLLWGFFPLYWHVLLGVTPFHILAYRIIFSLAFVAFLLFLQKKRDWGRHFRNPRECRSIVIGGLIITFNWGLYIWAVNSGRTIEAALGYFINPLVSVLFGLIFFREKLKKLQWFAFALAACGVTLVTLFSGAFPWISIFLALSFALYGCIKKTLSFDVLESLAAETLAAVPVAVFLLAFPFPSGQGLSDVLSLPPGTAAALFLAGPVTALPLYLFARGAHILPLSTLGFIQFLSPTFTFLTGVFIFREPFPLRNLIAYGLIWSSVIFYCLSYVRFQRVEKV